MPAFAETGLTVSPQANTACPAAFNSFKQDAGLSHPLTWFIRQLGLKNKLNFVQPAIPPRRERRSLSRKI
jgi:hypothetical protein